MSWNKRRMLEMAGIIHRSDTDTESGLLSESAKDTRERNKLARRSMMYGQDEPELARLRQSMPNKDDVIYDYDLFWNDETNSWWCNVVKYGKYDAFDTGIGDPQDPWRAAIASEGESSHWQQMTANSNFAGAWTNESVSLKESKELERYHMLKLAGLLTEGDEGEDTGGDEDLGGDEGGDDDLFGDDSGGDDLFGDDSGGGDMGGSGDGGGAESSEVEVERVPPSQLSNDDIAEFGSSTFMDLDTEMASMFNKHIKSASFGAQELEGAPGKAMEDEEATPAKEVPDEIEEDEEAEDKDEGTEEKEDKKEKQEESRWLLGRDRWLISEAMRLLSEGEDEAPAEEEVLPEEFNMDGFVLDFINKLISDPTHTEISELEKELWGRWYNMARQTILNNLTETEQREFEELLEKRLREMSGSSYELLAEYLFGESEDKVSYEVGSADIPVAVGAVGGGGGGGI